MIGYLSLVLLLFAIIATALAIISTKRPRRDSRIYPEPRISSTDTTRVSTHQEDNVMSRRLAIAQEIHQRRVKQQLGLSDDEE